MSDVVYIGIDVGREGGIVALRNGILSAAYKMPLTKEKETDAAALLEIVKNETKDATAHIVFERLNSFFGIGQSGIVGVSRESGIVEAVAQISGIPYTKITPKKWQNYIFANEKPIYKEVKVKNRKKADSEEEAEDMPATIKKEVLDTKKMSNNKFAKAFPNHKKFPIVFKNTGVMRDGISDAGNLALYGKMNNF